MTQADPNGAPPPTFAPPPPPPPAYGPPYPAVAPRVVLRKSPGAAGILSALPGLGHIYLGLYQRAFVFFAVFVALCAISHRSNAGELLPIFWWFFVLIDAVRQAGAINASGAAEPNLVGTDGSLKSVGSLGFGIFLILVGAFFLLDRYIPISLDWIADNWPALLIAFGGWQVYSYYKTKQKAESEGTTDA